ncbi:MAG: TM1812 family CRISPR-associated protein, partial [Archaeoglobaceae archaeon]
VYKNVGLDLNSVFLERDITEIEDATKNRERLEWRPLIKLYKEKVREMGGSKDKKRNFFAHSGFLKEYTEIKVSNREIYLRWNSEKIEEIKKWLLRPKS